jgi:hypothetical protein
MRMFLIGVIAIAAVAQAGTAQHPPKVDKQNAPPKQEALGPKPAVPAIVSSAAVVRPNDIASQPDPNVLADLKAQQRMATASEDLVALTKNQVWLGWANMIGLLVTIGLTGWAAMSASRAATAARDTIGIERAWLTSLGTNIGMTRQGVVNGLVVTRMLHLTSKWINSGRTPAINAQHFARHQIIPLDAQAQEIAVVWPVAGALAAIGPNLEFSGNFIGIGGEELDRLLRRETKIVLTTAVRYTDVYDHTVMRFSSITYAVSVNGFRHENGEQIPTFGTEPVGTSRAT